MEMRYFYHGTRTLKGPRPPHYGGLTITLRHTTLGSTSSQSDQPDPETSS